MSTPESDPSFAIPPGEYRPEALAPLIYHPDIAPETVHQDGIVVVVHACVKMARAALEHDDMAAYEGWADYIEQYLDICQQTDKVAGEPSYIQLLECYFHGTVRDNITAVEKVHGLLRTDPEGARMSEIMKLCARHNVSPVQWITQHAPTADLRARAWADYTYALRWHAEQVGRKLTAAELAVPGTEQYLQDFLQGNLSARRTIGIGTNILQLATNPTQKQHIVDRYSLMMSEYLSKPTPGENPFFWLKDMLRFAVQVNQDPDITLAEKQDLERQVRNATEHNPNLQPKDYFDLEITAAIARGESSNQIIGRINELISALEPAARQRPLRDQTLHTAVCAYAALGKFDPAATVLLAIDTNFVWIKTLEKYAQEGGPMQMVRQADSARQLLQGLDPQTPVDKAQSAARANEIAFIEGLIQGAFTKAEQALLRMAERARTTQNRQHLVIVDFARSLLHHHPQSAHIGLELTRCVDQISNFGLNAELYNLFTAHRGPGMQEANRSFTQSRADQFGRVLYFATFAGAALAEVGHYGSK